MNSLRLGMVMLVCIAGLSAAQGSFSSCPVAQSTSEDYFSATGKSSCDAYKFCATLRCACNGGTYSNTSLTCAVTTTGKTCTDVKPCQTVFIACLQAQASSASCLQDLKVAIVNVLAGTTYNGSSVDLACRADTCAYFNATSATNCTIAYSDICFLTASPTVAPGAARLIARLVLNGNYIVIIINPSSLFLFIQALNFDLTTRFRVRCNVSSITAGSAIAIFSANVAPGDAAFLAALTAAAADSSWLTSTRTAFTQLGGTGDFGIASLGATTSGATSSIAMLSAAFIAVVLAIFA